MAKIFVKAAALAAVAAMGLSANAAHAANATASAKANILTSVSVTKTADLDFGTIAPSNTAVSTVQVSGTGAVTCGTNLVCSGTTSAAGFTVAGAAGQTVSISADKTVTLNNTTTAGTSMTASLTPSVPSLVLTSTAANNAFAVAGTLSVAAGQAEGAYSGTFQVDVNYQ